MDSINSKFKKCGREICFKRNFILPKNTTGIQHVYTTKKIQQGKYHTKREDSRSRTKTQRDWGRGTMDTEVPTTGQPHRDWQWTRSRLRAEKGGQMDVLNSSRRRHAVLGAESSDGRWRVEVVYDVQVNKVSCRERRWWLDATYRGDTKNEGLLIGGAVEWRR